MGVVPNGRIEKVQFYETHRAPWEANAVAIGLTAAQVTALMDLVDDARNNYEKMLSKRNDALAATQEFNNSVTLMQNAGSAAIKAIKTRAAMTNDPNVYTLAQIPAPLPPGPSPTPGTPFELAVGLLGNGALELRWKCANPAGTSGTIYEVQRRLSGGGGGSFAYVGSTGTRKFIDETLPAGTAIATYQITAVRSTARGAPAQFLVNFGIGGGDGLLVQMLAAAGITNGGVFEGHRGGTGDGMETGLTASTVNGQAVRKTLPNSTGNGSAKRSHSRH